MITLIGTRWKRSNMLSQGVLIARLLLGNLEIIPALFALDQKKIFEINNLISRNI